MRRRVADAFGDERKEIPDSLLRKIVAHRNESYITLPSALETKEDVAHAKAVLKSTACAAAAPSNSEELKSHIRVLANVLKRIDEARGAGQLSNALTRAYRDDAAHSRVLEAENAIWADGYLGTEDQLSEARKYHFERQNAATLQERVARTEQTIKTLNMYNGVLQMVNVHHWSALCRFLQFLLNALEQALPGADESRRKQARFRGKR